MKNISRAVALIAAAGVLSFTLVAQPASAEGDCNTKSTKTKTSTTAKSACTAQARIYRYISVYPSRFDGPKGKVSTISETAGVEAGHATRTYYGGGWTWWYNF